MKKIILTVYLSIFGFACTTEKESLSTQLASCKIQNDSLMRRVQSLKHQIVVKDSLIEEQEVQLQIMQDELQFRESEISYWGHKYDSCIMVLKKRK